MALSYKSRRRWALIILLIGLPLYIVVVVNVIEWFQISSFLLQLVVFVGLGVIWAFPLKSIFKGIGQADPDAKE